MSGWLAAIQLLLMALICAVGLTDPASGAGLTVALAALVDVSGSMTLYARPFLAFLAGLMRADAASDAYLFHTRLVRITEALRDDDPLRALNRITLLADGFDLALINYPLSCDGYFLTKICHIKFPSYHLCQRNLKLVLKILELNGDRRLREMEFLCSFCNTFGLRNLKKNL